MVLFQSLPEHEQNITDWSSFTLGSGNRDDFQTVLGAQTCMGATASVRQNGSDSRRSRFIIYKLVTTDLATAMLIVQD
jgi:hypothetical protein